MAPYTSSGVPVQRAAVHVGSGNSYYLSSPLVYRGGSDLEWGLWNHSCRCWWGSLQPESSAWRTLSPEYLHCYFFALACADKGHVLWSLSCKTAGFGTPWDTSLLDQSSYIRQWMTFYTKKQMKTLHRAWLGWAEHFNRKSVVLYPLFSLKF